MLRRLALCLLLVLPTVAAAAGDGPIYSKRVDAGFDGAYRATHDALEAARFWVISEAHISDNLARFKDKWGEDYNRSGLDVIRSLSICNPWYTNQVANHDPAMLALCPFSVTIVSRGDTSTIFFARPTAMAADSPALEVLEEAEAEIIGAIEGAFAP